MSYIDKTLLTNEQIVYRTRKHLIIFFTPVIWVIAAILLWSYPNPYVMKVALVPALIAVVTFINQFLDYASSEFAVTNKRIIMREGFFFRHMNEMRLATVSNMSIEQSLLGRIFNYGTIIINPFGGKSDVFQLITHPLAFHREAQEQLDQVTSLKN